MSVEQELEIDPQEAQRALLHLRTPDGQEWVAAAILSTMSPVGGGVERLVTPGEDIRLLSFTIVEE